MRAIDADALLEHVWRDRLDSRERIADLVKSRPTIRPERKTGKWIAVDDADNRISGKCSVCGWESHLYEDDVVGMDYCPNCGARLEGE